MLKAKVIKCEKLAHDIFELTLETAELFNFAAGQYITIKVSDGNEKPCFRAYSICSRPPDDGRTLEFCIKSIEGGRGSTWLCNLKEGDEIEFMGPIGEFVLRTPEDKMSLFIATGTGVAPFKSMIEDQLSKGSEAKMHLLWGLRHIKDIYYKEYFEELDLKHSNFEFDFTLSQPEDDWHGNTGRVTELLEKINPGKKEYEAYICGLKDMVESVTEFLKKKGFKEKNIHTEKYD